MELNYSFPKLLAPAGGALHNRAPEGRGTDEEEKEESGGGEEAPREEARPPGAPEEGRPEEISPDRGDSRPHRPPRADLALFLEQFVQFLELPELVQFVELQQQLLSLRELVVQQSLRGALGREAEDRPPELPIPGRRGDAHRRGAGPPPRPPAPLPYGRPHGLPGPV